MFDGGVSPQGILPFFLPFLPYQQWADNIKSGRPIR
jgi:hypothetical protein